jgi:hypothetical protein
MLGLPGHGHPAERLSPSLIEAVEVLLVDQSPVAFDEDRVHPQLGPRPKRLGQPRQTFRVDAQRVRVRRLPTVVERDRSPVAKRCPLLRRGGRSSEQSQE